MLQVAPGAIVFYFVFIKVSCTFYAYLFDLYSFLIFLYIIFLAGYQNSDGGYFCGTEFS